MLDESEWIKIDLLHRQGFNSPGLSIEDKFRPMREMYYEITGVNESNHIAIVHHRISQYGDPCGQCGKPLRTPEAVFCAACGWRPSDIGE